MMAMKISICDGNNYHITKKTLRASLFKKQQYLIQHRTNSQGIGVQVKIRMFPCMDQSSLLFLPFRFGPLHVTSFCTHSARTLQEDKQIRMGHSLPHVLDKRMLLRNGACGITFSVQTFNQCGLSSTAWTNDANQWFKSFQRHLGLLENLPSGR